MTDQTETLMKPRRTWYDEGQGFQNSRVKLESLIRFSIVLLNPKNCLSYFCRDFAKGCGCDT